MCGRATVIDPEGVEKIAVEFHKKFNPADWRPARSRTPAPPRYNIRPTQDLPVVRIVDGTVELTHLRWGLIPAWSKEPEPKFPTFNARAETLAEKPTFRASFKHRRCLVLVDGFYEWPKKPNKDRRPRHIRFAGQRCFALAGLWDRWIDPVTGIPVDSCTIVTTEANEMLASVPHDRMPVILDDDAQLRWLDPEVTDRAQLSALLVPRSVDGMELLVTSEQFVNYGADDARCIAPVDAGSTVSAPGNPAAED